MVKPMHISKKRRYGATGASAGHYRAAVAVDSVIMLHTSNGATGAAAQWLASVKTTDDTYAL